VDFLPKRIPLAFGVKRTMTRPNRRLAIRSLAMAFAAAALAFASAAEARAHHHHHHHASSAPAEMASHGRHASSKAAPTKAPAVKADTASNGTVDKWTAAWARRHHVKLKGMVDTTPKEAKPVSGRHRHGRHEAATPPVHAHGRRHHHGTAVAPAQGRGHRHAGGHAASSSETGSGGGMCQSVRIHGQWVQRCHFPGQ
jgi:hypothetical protein